MRHTLIASSLITFIILIETGLLINIKNISLKNPLTYNDKQENNAVAKWIQIMQSFIDL